MVEIKSPEVTAHKTCEFVLKQAFDANGVLENAAQNMLDELGSQGKKGWGLIHFGELHAEGQSDAQVFASSEDGVGSSALFNSKISIIANNKTLFDKLGINGANIASLECKLMRVMIQGVSSDASQSEVTYHSKLDLHTRKTMQEHMKALAEHMSQQQVQYYSADFTFNTPNKKVQES